MTVLSYLVVFIHRPWANQQWGWYSHTGHLVLVPISGTAADSQLLVFIGLWWSCVHRVPLFPVTSDIHFMQIPTGLCSVHHMASSAQGIYVYGRQMTSHLREELLPQLWIKWVPPKERPNFLLSSSPPPHSLLLL